MTAGRLAAGTDGKLRGPATIEYNNPFPCPNGQPGSGVLRAGVLMHTMVTDLPQCIAIFNDRSKQASAHFGIAQDGTIHQFGPVRGWVAWHAAGANTSWYGIEHADHGNPNNPLTAAQLTASAQVVECLSAVAGFPLQVTDSPSKSGYGTHVMGGRAWSPDLHTCPDLPPRHVRSGQRAAIIALAKQIRNPPPVAAEEDDMPFAQLPQSTGGTVCVSWPVGSVKGFTVVTDNTGPVTFAVAEMHTSPATLWVAKPDLKVADRVMTKLAAADDCTAVQLTLKAGAGASCLHTYT